MFIYLDNAHFSALDALHRRRPAEFAEFLDFWLRYDCKLIVSRAHLHELGQSADDRDVKNRLDLIRYFSIWSSPENENVDWVIIREIRSQTLRRLRPATDPEPAMYTDVRDDLYRRVEFSEIEKFVWLVRPGLLDELRTRREFAGFENRHIRIRKGLRKATGRKEPKWDPNAWKMMPLVESLAPSASGDPVADRWMAEVRARGRECFEKASRKRHALICLYDLKDLAAVEQAPEQDLSRLGFYNALARHWVLPYCRFAGHKPEAIQEALNQFDPYDAPAISAALAVERGRKLHEKDYEASDYMDVDHVLWAAHTDLAFIDRRTHGFLLQAKKNPAVAQLLSPHQNVRFERAASLDDVKKHVQRLKEDRSES